jgi:hypothetical protein
VKEDQTLGWTKTQIAFTAWVVRAVVVCGVMYVGSLSLRAPHPLTATEPHAYAITPQRWLDIFWRWDTAFYFHIANVGYSPEEPRLAAFFPGFPMLVRGLAKLGADPFIAGIALNFAVFFIGLWVALAYAERVLPRSALPMFAAVTIACSGTYYFTGYYGEACFYLCIAAALFCVEESRHDTPRVSLRTLAVIAGLACAFAAVLRPQGLAVPLLVFLGALEPSRTRAQRVALLLAASCAVPTFVWHLSELAKAYGNPFAFLSAQAFWNRHPSIGGFFVALVNFVFDPDHFVAVYLSIAAVIARAARRAPWPETTLLAAMVFLPLSTGTVWTFPRFFLTMIPAHVEIAHPRVPRWGRAAYLVFMTAYALLQTYRLGRGAGFN